MGSVKVACFGVEWQKLFYRGVSHLASSPLVICKNPNFYIHV